MCSNCCRVGGRGEGSLGVGFSDGTCLRGERWEERFTLKEVHSGGEGGDLIDDRGLGDDVGLQYVSKAWSST